MKRINIKSEPGVKIKKKDVVTFGRLPFVEVVSRVLLTYI